MLIIVQLLCFDCKQDFISKQKPVTTGNQYPNQYPEYWPLHNVEDDELFSEILDEHIVEHIIPNTFSRNTDSFTDLYSPYHNPILPKSNLNAPEAFKPAVEKVHNFQQREQTLFRDDASRSAINTGVADYIDAIVQY